jgi:protein required for attachment to host cells
MNANTLVIVADAARARFFRVAKTEQPRASFTLLEVEDLVHPEARIKESDRHSGSFPAGVRSSMQGSSHTLNDHREAHEGEERHRFAKSVAGATARIAGEHSLNPVIVVATHSMRALVLNELERQLPKSVYVRSELGEFTEHSPAELFDELSQRGVFQA